MYGEFWSTNPFDSQFQRSVWTVPTMAEWQNQQTQPTWISVDPSSTGPTPAEAKALASRARAASMASDSLHGVQPRNSHHRSLRGYADAPRRPCYRGARGGR